MPVKLINIGFGNYISADKLISVTSPDSAPIKRAVQVSREKGLLIDASFGRSTKAVLFMENGFIVLSALAPETLSERVSDNNGAEGME
ncbi:MAG: DUF370 domain-containing protein [Oscillospiraceae bacterium]|nr:DUF370 domain-containing protein [Oscillospiraceae bacterium]